jgi:2-iminobutanoate/2-iminopropanoate deaminase
MTARFKQPVVAPAAPAGRGPYPQALVVGPLLFVSGQGPLSPSTNAPIQGNFEAQVRQTFSNVEAILTAAGFKLEHVAKVTVYLTDIQRVAEFNALYERWMPAPLPARTLVQVALRGIDVELDVTAVSPLLANLFPTS